MDMTSLRRNSNSAHLTKLLSVINALFLVYACATATQGQSRGQTSARDTARQIQRVERDQQLLLKPLPPNKEDNSARQAVLKQSKEDFKNIQGINNKMMANAWAKEELDYNSISESISQIRSKAIRLKSNLSLPESEKENEEKPLALSVANVKDFRAALLRLDKSIMSFVTNPVFKESSVMEVSLATHASHDLDTVIELSENLQKAAKSLNKKSKDDH
jgi:uncharacterized lipoprotein YehR (DUF1307 family)